MFHPIKACFIPSRHISVIKVCHRFFSGSHDWVYPMTWTNFNKTPHHSLVETCFRCLLVGRQRFFLRKTCTLYGTKTVDVYKTLTWWILTMTFFCSVSFIGWRKCCWMFFRSLDWNIFSKKWFFLALPCMHRFLYNPTFSQGDAKLVSCLQRGPRLDLAVSLQVSIHFFKSALAV